ncbi:DUF2278 family protein [Clostridium sp. Marseille-Q7071]
MPRKTKNNRNKYKNNRCRSLGLDSYGMLKCKIIDYKEDREDDITPHFQIHVQANNDHYSLAINVKSVEKPSELRFYLNKNFIHPIISKIIDVSYGFSYSFEYTLDYIRGDLGFTKEDMITLPYDAKGADNDITDKFIQIISEAKNKNADLYAFGAKWSPGIYKANRGKDSFKLVPNCGMHNIHMNQGNKGNHQCENGVYQDGGLLIHYPTQNTWTAVFLAFQSQSWNTDNNTGMAKD